MDLRIYPICTGTIIVDKGIHVTYRHGVGQETPIPSTCWLIKSDYGNILVDTGMCETECADKHHKGSIQKPGEDIVSQLKKIGVEADEISAIIFSHLHWDHCSNMRSFKNAKYYVTRKELEFALNPIPMYYKSYEYKGIGMEAPFIGVDFEIMEGVYEVIPGVVVIPTPGHSPGHCSVSVTGKKETYLIAGDAVFAYENLEREKGGAPITPIGRFVNVFDMWNSLLLIKSTGASVLPGHDFKVFEKEYYE